MWNVIWRWCFIRGFSDKGTSEQSLEGNEATRHVATRGAGIPGRWSTRSRDQRVQAQRRSQIGWSREVKGRVEGKHVAKAEGPDALGPGGCSDDLAFSEMGS